MKRCYGLTPKRSVSLTSIKLIFTGDLESQRTLHPLTPQLLLTTITTLTTLITLRWDHNQSKCLWSQINEDQFQPRQSPGAGSSSLWLSHDSTEWVDAAVMLKIKGWWDCSKIWVSLISQWTLLPTKWCNGETWVEINQHLMQISFFLFLILKDVCAFWHGMHHS